MSIPRSIIESFLPKVRVVNQFFKRFFEAYLFLLFYLLISVKYSEKQNTERMKKSCSFLLLLFLTTILWAQEPIKTNGVIKQVVLYRYGAFAKAEASVNVVKGPNVIEFRGLPYSINKESVQVGGKGLFTINSISNSTYSKENDTLDQKSKTNIITRRMDSLNFVLKELKDEFEVVDNEFDLLIKNQVVGSETTGLKLLDLKAAMTYFAPRFADYKLFCITNAQKQESIQKQINVLLYDLNNLSKSGANEASVIIDLTAENDDKITLTVDFLMTNCGWNPTYDVRTDGVSDKLNLTYKANAWQITGIDWKNIDFSLSTGNPSLNNNFTKAYRRYYALQETYFKNPINNKGVVNADKMPVTIGTHRTLSSSADKISGVVRDQHGNPLPFVNIVLMNIYGKQLGGTQTNDQGEFLIKPITPDAEYIVCSYVGYVKTTCYLTTNYLNINMRESSTVLQSVEIRFEKQSVKEEAERPIYSTFNNLTTTEFKINTPYTILSDGKENQVEINNTEFKAVYEYYAAPELNQQVFLTAKMLGLESSGYEEGPLNVFLNGSFVTTSTLKLPQTNDTAIVSLGYDKGVVLQRERVKNKSVRTNLGAKKVEVFAYNLNFRNTKNVPVQIQVQEQIPIAKSNNVSVSNLKYENASYDEETGIVTWIINLKPKEKVVLSYEFTISCSSKSNISIY